MLKKIAAFIVLFWFMISPMNAYAVEYYTNKLDFSWVDTAIEKIDKQNFENSIEKEKVKEYIRHFINNFSKYEKVYNSRNNIYVTKGKDGTYEATFKGAMGCLHYARFVSTTIYGFDASYIEKAIDQSIGHVTEEGLKKFIETEAQAGEYISIYNVHSFVFISCDDSGFYTLQYYGNERDPFFSYISYKELVNIVNNAKKKLIIYNSNPNLNCYHTYNNTGFCIECSQEFNITLTNIQAEICAIKDNVAVRVRPYQADKKIRTLKKGQTAYVVGQGYNSFGNLWYLLEDGSWVSGKSVEITIYPQIEIEDTVNAPTNFMLTQIDNSMASVSWTPVSNAVFYEIEYWDADQNIWKPDNDYINNTVTSYVSTGLDKQSQYDFRLRAVGSTKESEWIYFTYIPIRNSIDVVTAPANFILVRESDDTAYVLWEPSTNASSYEVEFWDQDRYEWRADYNYAVYLGTQVTSYRTSGLKNQSSYVFRVRAKNSYSTSEWVYYTYYI